MVSEVSSDGGLAHRDRVLIVRVTRWDVTDHHTADPAVFVATAVAVDVGVAVEVPPAVSGAVRGQRSQPHRQQCGRDDHAETSERPCLAHIRTSPWVAGLNRCRRRRFRLVVDAPPPAPHSIHR
jgi:hypothetical protein